MNPNRYPPGRYRAGEKVVILRDITNDGSYRTKLPGDLLAEEGERGEIVGVGYQKEMNRLVYFIALLPDERVIGCFEEDIYPEKRGERLLSGGSRGRS